MCAGLPTPPEPTLGASNLFILNNLLHYICKCAQTHKSTISKKVNLLYVAVDPSLYTHYFPCKVYPHDMYPFPNNIDEMPDFTVGTNNNKRAAAKITHVILLKTQNNVINMNAMFINTTISSISFLGVARAAILYLMLSHSWNRYAFHARYVGKCMFLSLPTHFDVLPRTTSCRCFVSKPVSKDHTPIIFCSSMTGN